MNQNPSEGRPEPEDILWNFFAREELEKQLSKARPALSKLAEAFATADVPYDASDVSNVVEYIHVKKAGELLYALSDQPDVYRKVGSPEIFVSFASQQQDQIRGFAEALDGASFKSFVSDKSIDYSKAWAEEIWGSLRICCVFLPIVTSDWLKSPWCMFELGAAISLNKHIVPVLVRDVVAPSPVSDYQGFQIDDSEALGDLRERHSELWQRILQQLRKMCFHGND